jgi:hypothetical protein
MGGKDKGHLDDCHPSALDDKVCDCETRQGIDPVLVVTGLRLAGWQPHRGSHSLHRFGYGDYIVTIAKVFDGWQYQWMRGPGYTIAEGRGFGTVAHCLTALWAAVFDVHDRYSKFLTEQSQRLVVIGLPPKPKIKYLVVISREIAHNEDLTVTPFDDLKSAARFHEDAGAQWSESFLCEVLKGPVV